jgi:hypothetical protein
MMNLKPKHFQEKRSIKFENRTQQSVHPTLGILARFQAFFYASAFSQSDGVPPPAPARVTQTVGLLVSNFRKSYGNITSKHKKSQ